MTYYRSKLGNHHHFSLSLIRRLSESIYCRSWIYPTHTPIPSAAIDVTTMLVNPPTRFFWTPRTMHDYRARPAVELVSIGSSAIAQILPQPPSIWRRALTHQLPILHVPILHFEAKSNYRQSLQQLTHKHSVAYAADRTLARSLSLCPVASIARTSFALKDSPRSSTGAKL